MDLPLIHETFRTWAVSLTEEGLPARFSHDFDTDEENLVLSALLLTARADPQRRSQGPVRRRPSSRPLAKLCYLVRIGAPERSDKCERALLSVMAQAQRTAGLNPLAEALSPSWWVAYGIPPRPAFLMEATVTETAEPADTAVVREHRLDLTAMQTLHGRVVAADDTPIPDAEIQISASGTITRSDSAGNFRLRVGTVGKAGAGGWVRVRARGFEQRLRVPESAAEQEPWLIRMEQLGR